MKVFFFSSPEYEFLSNCPMEKNFEKFCTKKTTEVIYFETELFYYYGIYKLFR